MSDQNGNSEITLRDAWREHLDVAPQVFEHLYDEHFQVSREILIQEFSERAARSETENIAFDRHQSTKHRDSIKRMNEAVTRLSQEEDRLTNKDMTSLFQSDDLFNGIISRALTANCEHDRIQASLFNSACYVFLDALTPHLPKNFCCQTEERTDLFFDAKRYVEYPQSYQSLSPLITLTAMQNIAKQLPAITQSLKDNQRENLALVANRLNGELYFQSAKMISQVYKNIHRNQP